MPLYLVTGGAGFIGSHIVHELVRRHACVRVLDNFSTGRSENLKSCLDRIDLIEGDLTDLPTVLRAVQGADYVLHQGALPSIPRSVKDPLATHHANATGTLNVLLAARESQVRRVVYASSSSIYGSSPALPKHEDLPTRPMSPYAASKLAGEVYCRAFTSVYGLQTISLRYFNVFGPRQDPESPYAAVIPKFICAMLRGRPPVIFGDGFQSRDFTFVANVVEANLLACTCKSGVGEVFNVGCGQRHSILDLVGQLNVILDTQIEPRFAEPRPGDVRHSMADIGALEQTASYKVTVGFHTGLKRTVDWFRHRAAI
jgi:UDP-glucose 4-epimerase